METKKSYNKVVDIARMALDGYETKNNKVVKLTEDIYELQDTNKSLKGDIKSLRQDIVKMKSKMMDDINKKSLEDVNLNLLCQQIFDAVIKEMDISIKYNGIVDDIKKIDTSTDLGMLEKKKYNSYLGLIGSEESYLNQSYNFFSKNFCGHISEE
jgi:hypothetical protein